MARPLARSPVLRVWRLPDGSTLAVEAVTFGTEHRFIHGSAWQRLLLPALPGPAKPEFARAFGCRDTYFPSRSGDSLVVWTHLRRAGSTSPRFLRVIACDEEGNESLPGRMRAGEYLDGAATERVAAWELPSFPRRGKTLRLRFYDRGFDSKPSRIGELTLPNPAAGRYPNWQAGPFPCRKQAGDLEFALTGLTTSLDKAQVVQGARSTLATLSGQPVAESRQNVWSRADFRITRRGKPETAWQPIGAVLSDATGNTFVPRPQAPDREGGGARLFFGGALFPKEPVWKLRVEFARAAAFAPDELWTVRGLAVPGADAEAALNVETAWQGTTVRLSRARTTYTYRDPWRPDTERFTLHLEARISPWTEGQRLTLVRALGDGARVMVPEAGGDYGGEFLFRAHAPTPVHRVDLTFALHTSRTVEFLARPSTAAEQRRKPDEQP